MDFPGSIRRVKCKPYDYNIPGTDEIVNIKHTWEYLDDIEEVVSENILEAADII